MGWTGKDHGVGMARKTLMDAIDLWCTQDAAASVSAEGMSAEHKDFPGRKNTRHATKKAHHHPGHHPQPGCRYGIRAQLPGFGGIIVPKHPTMMGLSNPYYHKLTGEEALDRAMLRYEIYMRHYAINMWRIGSPYSFTALGRPSPCRSGLTERSAA
jgi:hypothetical protein